MAVRTLTSEAGSMFVASGLGFEYRVAGNLAKLGAHLILHQGKVAMSIALALVV